MNGRGMRVARGLAAAGIATFVAGFSHAAAGGGAPGGAGLALALAFSAVVCVLLTRRSLSLPLLAVSVVVSQFAFHLLFEVGNGGSMAAGSFASLEHAGHHGGTGGGAQALAASAASVPTSSHLHDSGWMWVAHAVAAVATIALLHRGERMLRHLLTLARTPLQGGLRAARIRFAAAVALVVPVAAREVRARLRAAVRLALESARVHAVDRLAECGIVFARLRHRGPPVPRAAFSSV